MFPLHLSLWHAIIRLFHDVRLSNDLPGAILGPEQLFCVDQTLHDTSGILFLLRCLLQLRNLVLQLRDLLDLSLALLLRLFLFDLEQLVHLVLLFELSLCPSSL